MGTGIWSQKVTECSIQTGKYIGRLGTTEKLPKHTVIHKIEIIKNFTNAILVAGKVVNIQSTIKKSSDHSLIFTQKTECLHPPKNLHTDACSSFIHNY